MQVYLWQVTHFGQLLMVMFGYSNKDHTMNIKICVLDTYPKSSDGLLRFICNYLAHLLAR